MDNKDKRIYLFDTTLRDGEQSPGISLSVKEKLEIAGQLKRLGIDVIEAGFPIISAGDFEAVKTIADKVKGPVIAGLCRAEKADIDRAWEALKGAENALIHIFLATSDLHLRYKLNKTREQVAEAAVAAVKHAKRLCPNVEFSAEDASRSDIEFLAQVVARVIEAGATIVNIPDTVGYAIPEEYGEFIRNLIGMVPNHEQAVFSVHCHNDLGMAVANSLAGLLNGARQIEGTINGIGERAGNAALEEIIMALYTRKHYYGKETAIDYGEIYRTSRLVSNVTGVSVPANKAIVGKNAFLHESGIHQDGVLKNRLTYEIMSAKLIGVSEDNLVLGKHSGRHALKDRLEKMGYTLSDEELAQAFVKFKDLADKKKEITQADLEALAGDQSIAVPEKYTLSYLQISSGTGMIPTATVKLDINNMSFETAAIGDGPVEAACRAVDKITDIFGKMLDYKLNAVGEGKDALGEVVSHIQIDGKIFTGRGLSTDVIEASVKSYVNAINKYSYQLSVQNQEK